MIAKPEILKQHLFRYFPSLNAYQKKYLNIFFQNSDAVPEHIAYLCPICVSTGLAFLEEFYLDTNPEFTLDHFPPESVGGIETIYVCKKCNNEAGLGFESSLKQKVQDISFNNKVSSAKRKIKTKISTIKGNYPGILLVREDGAFAIDFKASEKVHAPLLDQWIERSNGDYNWTAEVTYLVADENKVSKALLKAAFLFCFQYWGYGFSYSHTADSIRKILNNEMQYPLRNPSFWLGKFASTVERIPLGLCFILHPVELKCFCINMVLVDRQTKHREIATVIIPGPNQEDWEDLIRIQTILDDEPTIPVTFAHVMGNSPANDIFDGYERSWEYLKSAR
jgi:hypothetical protein